MKGFIIRLRATLYVKNSYEAVECYKEAFGLTLGYHLLYDDIEGFQNKNKINTIF